MWKGCWRGNCAGGLVWANIVIADPSVWGFEGIIQSFEVTAIGMNVCGT